MTADEIKPFKNQKVLLEYGETGKLVGTINYITGDRVHLKVGKADYGFPISDVRNISPVAVA